MAKCSSYGLQGGNWCRRVLLHIVVTVIIDSGVVIIVIDWLVTTEIEACLSSLWLSRVQFADASHVAELVELFAVPGLPRWAVFKWRSKVSCLANFLLQHGHNIGFIWRCIERKCRLRSPMSIYGLQKYVLDISICIRRCSAGWSSINLRVSLPLWQKPLLQCGQPNGFSLLWNRWWVTRSECLM